MNKLWTFVLRRGGVQTLVRVLAPHIRGACARIPRMYEDWAVMSVREG